GFASSSSFVSSLNGRRSAQSRSCSASSRAPSRSRTTKRARTMSHARSNQLSGSHQPSFGSLSQFWLPSTFSRHDRSRKDCHDLFSRLGKVGTPWKRGAFVFFRQESAQRWSLPATSCQ